ncbi:MAG TPA: decaprenyl-phosphate phosphoribosyltransferase [Gemmatimonadaceae bacterium]
MPEPADENDSYVTVATQQRHDVDAPTLPAGVGAPASAVRSWLRAVRPEQWLKNGFVLSPLVFSGRALIWDAQWRALVAFTAFCAVASAVYLMNDVLDRDADRLHPQKASRPVAAGLIRPRSALVGAVLLGSAGLAAGAAAGISVAIVLLSYLVLNVLYGMWLKNVVIVDVFAIAAFFIMRLVAGSAAVAVRPSIWLLLCGGLLALYLGFAKRRHELVLLGRGSHTHRAVLASYSTVFLDQLSVVLLSVTIVSYIMYTLESETAQLVGTETLSYSTAFVLYGVLRYLYLVHRNEGGNPTETLLTDRALMAAVLLWGLYCGGVIYLAR